MTPHLEDEVVTYLDVYLEKHMSVLEFGAGESTVWFAERVKFVRSLEHDDEWYSHVSDWLHKRGLRNVQLQKFNTIIPDWRIESTSRIYNTCRYDIVLIDNNMPLWWWEREIGRFAGVHCEDRFSTTFRGLGLIKDSGILIIDDVGHGYDILHSILELLGWKHFLGRTTKCYKREP